MLMLSECPCYRRVFNVSRDKMRIIEFEERDVNQGLARQYRAKSSTRPVVLSDLISR